MSLKSGQELPVNCYNYYLLNIFLPYRVSKLSRAWILHLLSNNTNGEFGMVENYENYSAIYLNKPGSKLTADSIPPVRVMRHLLSHNLNWLNNDYPGWINVAFRFLLVAR